MSIIKRVRDEVKKLVGGVVVNEFGQVWTREKILKWSKKRNTEEVRHSFAAPDGSDLYLNYAKDKKVEELLNKMEKGDYLQIDDVKYLVEFALRENDWSLTQLLKIEYANEVEELEKNTEKEDPFGERKHQIFATGMDDWDLFKKVRINRKPGYERNYYDIVLDPVLSALVLHY